MIRVGTRGSALALAQARLVAEPLERGGAAVEVVAIRTEGDRRAEAHLAAIGGKGLFVREIEEALLRGEIDVAVHSLKDLPAELPRGLCLAAFPAREDARDVLVSRAPTSLDRLPPGAVVGTSSPRRRALLRSLRPDLTLEAVRGNVDTRLRKLEGGDWDAIVLAAAGLHRLGLAPAHAAALDPDVFVPAVGQGILALEARVDDRATLAALTALDHPATRACALAERAYLRRLGASCVTPVAAHARLDGATLRLVAVVASEDGTKILRESAAARAAEAEALGRGLADALLERGAGGLVALNPPVADRSPQRPVAQRSHRPSISGHPRPDPGTRSDK